MRVFVSHAGRDRAWAEWVAWQLEHAGWGVSVELDCWDWQAGDNFVAKMNTALSSCDRMLAICSQSYYEPARWTGEEWTAAVRMAKERSGFLVPVRIDEAPPPPLLAPLIAPALHGLPKDQARAALLGAIRPPGRPDREPPLPGAAATEDLADGPRLPGVLPPVWGSVPGRNEAFTGRDAMLVQLRDGLQGSGRSVVHALHGAGGVGKSQLATEYAWRFANDYEAVWWINAEQAERIAEQYAAFAVAWGLVDPATQVQPAVDALRAQCRTRGRWLVVLDNATSARDVHHWLLAGQGHVLVTSRDPRWPEIATTVSVDVFARKESIALLRAHLPALTDAQAGNLAEALGDLPLALAQAAGVLAETGMPATQYLDLLDTTASEVLDEGTPISYPRSLAKSLRIALDQLTAADPAATQLLRLCAFLAPDPIPTHWFPTAGPGVLPEPLAATVTAPLAFRRTLSLLSRYGLAKLADDRLTVHRLTQRLLRADAPDPTYWAETVTSLLATLGPRRPTDPTTWPAWAELLPHLRKLDLAATDNDRVAWQACEAAAYLLRRGDPRASHTLIAPLYQAWRDRRGPTADPTLWAANYLAQALSAIGRPQEAITLDRELHTYYRTTHGDDHPETLGSANNLANRLTALGEHEQARALDEDTLTRRRRTLGPDHPDSLSSAHNLAVDLIALDEYEQARALAEDILTRRRRILGHDHPNTLNTAHNLVRYLTALGEHEQARALAEDTLARRRRIVGHDHPDTLKTAALVDQLTDDHNRDQKSAE
jgi:TIR domain/Tetratricopeptide repeat